MSEWVSEVVMVKRSECRLPSPPLSLQWDLEGLEEELEASKANLTKMSLTQISWSCTLMAKRYPTVVNSVQMDDFR